MVTIHFASLRRAPMRLGGGLALAALLVTGIASADKVDDDQFREDVLTCEEAVAHLVSCCPGFNPSNVLCDYYYSFSSGCGDSTTRHVDPALTLGDSICIRQRSCNALIDQGVCERAEKARRRETTTHSSSSSGGSLNGGSSSSSSGATANRGPTRVCP